MRCEPTRTSLGPDEIDEYAFVVVPQVGQVVGEVGEVVAGADLSCSCRCNEDRGQHAAQALTDIPEVKRSNLRIARISGVWPQVKLLPIFRNGVSGNSWRRAQNACSI